MGRAETIYAAAAEAVRSALDADAGASAETLASAALDAVSAYPTRLPTLDDLHREQGIRRRNDRARALRRAGLPVSVIAQRLGMSRRNARRVVA